MTEQHECCNNGLCQEAATEKLRYWESMNTPSMMLRLEPFLTENHFVGQRPDLPEDFKGRYCVQHGELSGGGDTPRKAYLDFDKKWYEAQE